MENLWLMSLVALIVGAVIGYMLGRNSPQDNRQAELEEELEEARQALENYREDVAQHFSKTANLFNNLTDSYKDVYQHLAGGAQQLCQSEEIVRSLESSIKPQLAQEDSDQSGNAEPPRDYAPKAPGDAGTLSENYGVDDKKLPEEETPEPSKAAS
ncbi:YhcB family protein [Pontibacter sp. JAM-7]